MCICYDIIHDSVILKLHMRIKKKKKETVDVFEVFRHLSWYSYSVNFDQKQE